ncbi:MAG TPA: CDP-alcohol phosphatidyltransferase family protein, partial [Oscillospiraceae bacterium]|nr:CDP-alcohol phosphatidyltransferase family protein [Oscillospiraceae bacterium]
LTLVRLLAIVPLVILLSYWPKYKTTSFIFFLSIWLTDMLDGYIARTFNQITDFGKLFDPVVDKLFQIAVAVTLAAIGRLPVWVPTFIVCREALMILGGYLLLKNYEVVVYSDVFGKLATVFYVIGFTLLFFVPDEPGWLRHVIFIPGVALSVIATLNYARKNIDNIKNRKKAAV